MDADFEYYSVIKQDHPAANVPVPDAVVTDTRICQNINSLIRPRNSSAKVVLNRHQPQLAMDSFLARLHPAFHVRSLMVMASLSVRVHPTQVPSVAIMASLSTKIHPVIRVPSLRPWLKLYPQL